MRRFLLCSFAAVGLLALCRATFAQAPSISYTLPSAVKPGQPTDVTVYGANLADAKGMWTSFPGAVELAPDVPKNGQDKSKVVYRITAPAESPLGVGGLRVATTKGVSNLRLVMIDDLPSEAESGKNKTLQTAQVIQPPVAIDGACESESYDFFKFTGKAGQRVSVEVFARRFGFGARSHDPPARRDGPRTGLQRRRARREARLPVLTQAACGRRLLSRTARHSLRGRGDASLPAAGGRFPARHQHVSLGRATRRQGQAASRRAVG